MTAVAGSTFTAAQFNQYVRDLFLECPTAKVSSAGQYAVATAANTMAARAALGATVATSETTTSTTYVDLTTVGPAVTITTGTSAVVFLKCAIDNNTANTGTFMGFSVSGASSVAAADANAIDAVNAAAARSRFGGAFFLTGLTAGSNIFTAKYKVAGASTGTFTQRDLFVIPF